MRETFLDTVISGRNITGRHCVQKTISIPKDLMSQLEDLRKFVNKTSSKRVTMAYLLRSIVQYHVQYIADIASLEDLGDKINTEELDYIEIGGLLYSRPAGGEGESEPELVVELEREVGESEELDDEAIEDQYILKLLGESKRKPSNASKKS